MSMILSNGRRSRLRKMRLRFCSLCSDGEDAPSSIVDQNGDWVTQCCSRMLDGKWKLGSGKANDEVELRGPAAETVM